MDPQRRKTNTRRDGRVLGKPQERGSTRARVRAHAITSMVELGTNKPRAGIKQAACPAFNPQHNSHHHHAFQVMSDAAHQSNKKHGEATAATQGRKKRNAANKMRVGRDGRAAASYTTGIRRVLAQVAPDAGLSTRSIELLNAITNHICTIILEEAVRVAAYNRKATISDREIQTAVRIIIGGELAKHAISDGAKAMARYQASVAKQGC